MSVKENSSISADLMESVQLQLQIPKVRGQYCGVHSSHTREALGKMEVCGQNYLENC